MRSGRIHGLDLLRGLAAVVVLAHHTLLLDPRFVSAQSKHAVPFDLGDWLWWASSTPLKVLSAGHEAVLLFFLLSGYVLVRQLDTVSRPDWGRYLSGRMVRLWLPALASVAFATILIWSIPRVPYPGSSSWQTANTAVNVSPGRLLDSIDLFAGGFSVNNPLWSIRWEIVFSLLLPLAVPGARMLARRPRIASGALLLCATICGALGAQALTFLPIFLLGGVFALRQRTSAELGPWTTGVLVIGSLVLVSTPWVLGGAVGSIAWQGIDTLCAASGALALVFVFESSSGLDRLGRRVSIIGRSSFSLYLVHVPVVVALAYVSKQNSPATTWIFAAVAIGCALVFLRFVELPSHALARRIQRGWRAADGGLGGTGRATVEIESAGEPATTRRIASYSREASIERADREPALRSPGGGAVRS